MNKIKLQTNGCIKFRERTSADTGISYLTYKESTDMYTCSSTDIGRTPAEWPVKQAISLNHGGCIAEPSLMHEILHALGFYHEHARWDRSDYVAVNYANIQTNHYGDYAIQYGGNTLGLPYDLYSIMHYHAYAFGIDQRQTMISQSPYVNSELLGNSKELSHFDVLKVQKYYECPLSVDVVKRFKNTQTQLQLNSVSSTVNTQSSNTGSSELWIVRPINGDSYNLINVYTGYFLEGHSSGNVYAFPRNWGESQRWTFNGFYHRKLCNWLCFRLQLCTVGLCFITKLGQIIRTGFKRRKLKSAWRFYYFK